MSRCDQWCTEHLDKSGHGGVDSDSQGREMIAKWDGEYRHGARWLEVSEGDVIARRLAAADGTLLSQKEAFAYSAARAIKDAIREVAYRKTGDAQAYEGRMSDLLHHCVGQLVESN